MEITTLSKKYQIVVPRKVREKMGLRAGERIAIYPLGNQKAVLMKQPKSHVDELAGLGKEVWDALGGVEYIRRERKLWDKKS